VGRELKTVERSPSVTRSPFLNSALMPSFSSQVLISGPPPCTKTGRMPTHERSTRSLMTPAYTAVISHSPKPTWQELDRELIPPEVGEERVGGWVGGGGGEASCEKGDEDRKLRKAPMHRTGQGWTVRLTLLLPYVPQLRPFTQSARGRRVSPALVLSVSRDEDENILTYLLCPGLLHRPLAGSQLSQF